MASCKTGQIAVPFIELGNLERVPFGVEENHEFSFEQTGFEVPLSHPRGNGKQAEEYFGAQKKDLGWTYPIVRYHLSIGSN